MEGWGPQRKVFNLWATILEVGGGGGEVGGVVGPTSSPYVPNVSPCTFLPGQGVRCNCDILRIPP